MAFPTCPLFGGSTVFPWKLSMSFTGSSTYVATFPTFSFWRFQQVESVESFSRILSRMLIQSLITFIAFAARHSCLPGPNPSCAVGREGERDCGVNDIIFSHDWSEFWGVFRLWGVWTEPANLPHSIYSNQGIPTVRLLASESAHLPLSPLLSNPTWLASVVPCLSSLQPPCVWTNYSWTHASKTTLLCFLRRALFNEISDFLTLAAESWSKLQ